MGKQELNNWAVMNYSMEDRGNLPQEPHHGHGLTQKNQTERFLSGNLSYFGVSVTRNTLEQRQTGVGKERSSGNVGVVWFPDPIRRGSQLNTGICCDLPILSECM